MSQEAKINSILSQVASLMAQLETIRNEPEFKNTKPDDYKKFIEFITADHIIHDIYILETCYGPFYEEALNKYGLTDHGKINLCESVEQYVKDVILCSVLYSNGPLLYILKPISNSCFYDYVSLCYKKYRDSDINVLCPYLWTATRVEIDRCLTKLIKK